MCCIALERYLAIVHPLWYQWSRRHKLLTVYLMCLAAWTILVLPVVFSFHIGYKDADESFCKESYPSKKEFAAYRLVTIPITFLLPLFFLAFVYQLVRSHLDEAISVPAKEKKGITGLLLLIMLVFLLVFGPYHVVGYVMHFGSYLNQDSCSHEAQVFLYFQMALGLLSINILLDPVMYIFLSQDATTGTPLWAFYLVSQGRSMKWVTAVVNAGRIRLNECPSKLCSSAQSTIVQ
ncbi:GPR4 protein, partial [Amia calva]|nr:GPR4 protein [Amia calva]